MRKPSLFVIHPELAAQWHTILNGDKTPEDVTYGNQFFWWQCDVAEDHVWKATPNSRASANGKLKNGCPCCDTGCGIRKVVLSNCLATTYPHIAAQWHSTKNGLLTPYVITAGSGVKVWWKCYKGKFPDGSFADDHEWLASPAKRCRQHRGCPCCCGMKAVRSNCLVTTHPEIAAQWHATKNGILTPYDVVAGSKKQVWWKCDIADDHEWVAMISNRTTISDSNKGGCPYCNNMKVSKSNCFGILFPEIAVEWHPTKNSGMFPYDVTYASEKLVWWQCHKCGCEWKKSPGKRTGLCKYGCPKCNESKGERAIAECLSKLGISYERECKIDSCKNKRPLPFDFMIEIRGGTKAIEYQGRQHYIVESFGSIDGNFDNQLAEIQHRDSIKRKWCKDNNVPLLEIPYWEYDRIEQILMEFLNG